MGSGPAVISIIGPSASGKGTQARMLADYLSFPQINISQFVAALSREQSTLSQTIRERIAQGAVIDVQLIRPLYATILKKYFYSGVILDGFPRTQDQAQMMVEMLDQVSRLIVIEINLPDNEILNRINHRLSQPGYTPTIDDDIATVKDKLLLYNSSKLIIEQTIVGFMMDHQKVNYTKIDGLESVEVIQQRIRDFVLADLQAVTTM